ncbi:MAG: DUF4450 domain-containing protein [Bacteroidales bacterium]|nr:DUF4450 domain-containing protein [Bacteroidales bacterium]
MNIFQNTKQFFISLNIYLFFIPTFMFTGIVASAKPAGYKAGDSLWHNIPRAVRYQPDNGDFVIRNGDKRFNRALYGTNTGFRVETGDLPEFALYMPGMGGNLKLGIALHDTPLWLTDAASIEARYRPGSMVYEISDNLLGYGKIQLEVMAMAGAEGVIIKVAPRQLPEKSRLYMAYGGATGKRFPREGDIGADPATVFDMKPEYCKNNEFYTHENMFRLYYGPARAQSEDELYENDFRLSSEEKKALRLKNKKRLYGLVPPGSVFKICDAAFQNTPAVLLSSTPSESPVIVCEFPVFTGDDLYLVIWNPETKDSVSYAGIPGMVMEAEKTRKEIAGQVKLNTPDEHINALGATLSIAADAVWEEPSYLHGAVAWRMRLPGWRGAYAADWMGWHDRARIHFNAYLKSQYLSPDSGPNMPDPKTNLARQEEKEGNSLFTSGYISRNPNQVSKPHHYDMNLVFFDQLLRHLKWTGDKAYAREIWPALKRHLAWEKRCFDGNGDGLYDAYAAIWASDALQYSGGGVTHSSSYNYKANSLAAEIARWIGEDPDPYYREAAKIKKAVNSLLWMPDKGWYAEYKDLLGLQQVHPSAAVWTVYHALDAGIADPFSAYQSLRYIDTQIPHIPVKAKGMTDGSYHVLGTTSWMPYTWSINNVALPENLHTSLAYWQGSRYEEAFNLWKSSLIESMYMGSSPGNFQQLSFYDAFRGELYRDFADPIGVAARTLVEGLFGIAPDAIGKILTVQPGLPDKWNAASLATPDFEFDYLREKNIETYNLKQAMPVKMKLRFCFVARAENIESVMVNGKNVSWQVIEESIGTPRVEILSDYAEAYNIEVRWQGQQIEKKSYTGYISNTGNLSVSYKFAKIEDVYDPQSILNNLKFEQGNLLTAFKNITGNRTIFIKLRQAAMVWWEPVNIELREPVEIVACNSQEKDILSFKVRNNTDTPVDAEYTVNQGVGSKKQRISIAAHSCTETVEWRGKNLFPGSNLVRVEAQGIAITKPVLNWNIDDKENANYKTLDLSAYFNDSVTAIFKNRYLSPRSPYPTLQLPVHGIGDWCSYKESASIDDRGLRQLADGVGIFKIPQGVPFRTPFEIYLPNIIYTSRWDNYPAKVVIPLEGKADHVYLLMAGSTHHMQSRFVNAKVTVVFEDGTSEVLELKNPENWWPIEQDFYEDGFAFSTGAPRPLRLHLKTGRVTLEGYNVLSKNKTIHIDGGAANILDIPLNRSKNLKELHLETTANDVVIGLMAVTLLLSLK